MTQLVPRESKNRITWTDFIQMSEKFGVTVRQTHAPVPGTSQLGWYLHRQVIESDGPVDLWFPLPKEFAPGCDLKMGVWNYERACARLRLNDREVCRWPVVF